MADTKDILIRVYHLNDKRYEELTRNKKTECALLEVATESGLAESGSDKAVGNLLLDVATKFPERTLRHRSVLAASVGKGEIKSKVQLSEALNFFSRLGDDEALDLAKFRAESGIGVEYSREETDRLVRTKLAEREAELVEKRHALTFVLLKELKSEHKWADPGLFKAALESEIERRFGKKEDAVPAPKSEAPPAKKEAPKKDPEEEKRKDVTLSDAVVFWAPHENTQRRPELLEAHLRATGGKVVTRFPPEPNGYLHIGHCKAMNLSFGYAKKTGGKCYMRFDDTNPESESPEYIDSILDNVKWMGHEWCEITHASDYFPRLYECARELIRRGKAFVCHQSVEEMKRDREAMKHTHAPVPSPWRDRAPEESLRLFEAMKEGRFEEGAATLRMRMDLTSANPVMWDPVAYRIKFHPHPMTGDKWCIYPSYDFTHCLCDSFENITHSLCSLEFNVRRESYYWLVDALDLYRPPQWEFARLNLTYTIMSKRKLIQLVKGGYVRGWDDPRLPTINGVRRRGFPAAAINQYCESIGITRTNTVQPMDGLEEAVRAYLDERAPRRLVVLDPLRVVLVNMPAGESRTFAAPEFPKYPERGEYSIAFKNLFFIERGDFRADGAEDKKYFRLAPGKEVRLRYGPIVRAVGFKENSEGRVEEVQAEVLWDAQSKPKGVINWVADGEECEVRLYERLFKSAMPEGETVENKRSFLDDLNEDSLRVVVGRMDRKAFGERLKVMERFQFERNGYFVVDADTTEKKVVFNRIVSLHEDKDKN